MKKVGLIVGILLMMSIVAISGCTSSGNKNSINVTNLQASSGGYGMYTVTCDLVPAKDISYLEMVGVWYDSENSVIYRSPLMWNMNNAKAGEKIKVTGQASLYQKGTPAKVKIMIFDSSFGSGGDESKNIFNQTIPVG